MRARWGFRMLALVWGVLQFALPAAASWADAQLERDSVGARVAHVEATSSATCRPEHSAACVLCQVAGRAAERSEPVGLTFALVRAAFVPSGSPSARHESSDLGLPDARGPPVG